MKPGDPTLEWMIEYDEVHKSSINTEWNVETGGIIRLRKDIISGKLPITSDLMRRISFSPSLTRFVLHSICLKRIGETYGTDT